LFADAVIAGQPELGVVAPVEGPQQRFEGGLDALAGERYREV